ncbi:hypothetical protein DMJ13_20640 [halophilic archaeon]|nr:hypothetical protein DMJ13_20640 [halophilic archaeon]
MLLGDTDETYIVTLSETEWVDLADHLVIDDPTLAAVQTVHQSQAETLLDATETEVLSENTTPFIIDYPDNWALARDMIHQHWGYFLHQGLSPAELLDYWIVQKTEFTPKNWAKVRDVHPEAVRKNIRQAKNKLSRPY